MNSKISKVFKAYSGTLSRRNFRRLEEKFGQNVVRLKAI